MTKLKITIKTPEDQKKQKDKKDKKKKKKAKYDSGRENLAIKAS